VAEQWEATFEVATGDTHTATQTATTLEWLSGTVTLRQRAPHVFDFRLPRTTVPGQRAADFRAGRQFWLKRNGVYWFAGFMNSATLSGYDRTARAFKEIALPGWGNAYALMLDRNTQSGATGTSYAGFDVDGIISNLLDECEHGGFGSTDWFEAAGRTIYASGTSIPPVILSGKSSLEHITDLCDVDGADWRAGVNAAGAFTFEAGTSVVSDLSASITLYDGANCQIVDIQRDGSLITTSVFVACKRPQLDTRVTTAVLAGATSIALDSVAGLVGGSTAAEADQILIGVGLATEETKLVTSISGTTVSFSALANNHAADEVVKMASPGQYRFTSASSAASVYQAYHERVFVLYNDALTDPTRRAGVGAAYIAAYDHPLTTATVEIVDATLIGLMLDAGLEPGDSVSLTSPDPEVSQFYSGTTVVVQEMTLDLEPGRVKQVTLMVGDPRQTEYARFERRLAAMQAAATVAYGA
jgi:hypothetical protein